MFGQVSIGHFEHLIDQSFNLLLHLAVANQGICSKNANLEESTVVRNLHFIEFFDYFKYLIETKVEELVCFTFEIIITNENTIV
jgi:hypothetical protein